MNIISKNDHETQQVGEEFAKQLKPGDVVLLFGDLGAGKTTFTKGLARGLGIQKRIISPTFILQRTHSFTDKKGYLAHVDLYRLDENAIKNMGIEDVINEDNIVVIEWAEKLTTLPKQRWEVYLKHLEEESRSIEILKK